MALFRAKTVNLAELATVWGGKTAEASNYKRMQRFFRSFEVKMEQSAKMVMSIASIPQPWVLSIDRTNWSFDTTHFNISMLCVVHEAAGDRLMWTMLDNSDSTEPMDLLDRFEEVFPDAEIAYPKQKSRKTDDDFLMIITTHAPQTALADYGKRWGIETLFGALKTRGFCLESTHFTDGARLSKLLALLALAFVWAMKARLWRHTQQLIRLIKAHGRRARSLFRYGKEFLPSYYQFSGMSPRFLAVTAT
jgi:hypothetical protein